MHNLVTMDIILGWFSDDSQMLNHHFTKGQAVPYANKHYAARFLNHFVHQPDLVGIDQLERAMDVIMQLVLTASLIAGQLLLQAVLELENPS